MINEIFAILLAGIISENYAILGFLGTGAVIENKRPALRSLLLGLGTTLVMVVSVAITWLLNDKLLCNYPDFRIMAYVIVVMAVAALLRTVGSKVLDFYCRADFITFSINGAVLGLCLNLTELELGSALLKALAVGVGFTLSLALFGKLREKAIDEDAVPESFKGLPVTLLTAGMICLALLALSTIKIA